jgi:hypothetical protein
VRAGKETVAFQLQITAGLTAGLTGVSVSISPLTGPGTTITFDNAQKSAAPRFLEAYLPESYPGPGNRAILPVQEIFPIHSSPSTILTTQAMGRWQFQLPDKQHPRWHI